MADRTKTILIIRIVGLDGRFMEGEKNLNQFMAVL